MKANLVVRNTSEYKIISTGEALKLFETSLDGLTNSEIQRRLQIFGFNEVSFVRSETVRRLCPQAIFIPGNFAEYRKASRKFMAILADFSPFLQPMGLDES
jgi:nucleotidyltransferase/DNA polymerase involved in DNA repair